MGNRLNSRVRHRKSTSADASTTSNRTGKSPPSAGSVSVRLRAAAAAMGAGYRRGGRSAADPVVVSCPNLGDEDPADAGHRQPALSGRTTTDDDGVDGPPRLTVYRSYGSGFEAREEDEAGVPGRLTTVADSVPDIKIYRRSAILYNDDDDDHNNALRSSYHPSNHRFPSRSRSAADHIGNGNLVYAAAGQRRREREHRGRAPNGRTAAVQPPSSPVSPQAASPANNGCVTTSDFPSTETVGYRLRQFENHFLSALSRRHAGLPSDAARLSIVSFAIHLQSRPRRTVSLLQYLTGGGGVGSTIPRQLLDPDGDNDGEYILTVPDALFHLAMCARDAAAAASAATAEECAEDCGKADRKKRPRRTLDSGTADSDGLSGVDEDMVGAWLGLADELVRCAGREAARELARMFEYQIALLTEDRAVRLLAEHSVECAAAYVEHQRGVWERNSLVRGAVFGAVFGHTESVSAPVAAANGRPDDSTAAERRSRRVSVIVGHRELKWDIGDILKRPGLRRDRLLYGVDASTTAESAGRRTSVEALKPPTSDSADGCPWTFNVSAACDAALYGYRGALLDWDYFACAYAPVADDEGWFNEVARPGAAGIDFHRLYRPYRCLVGTELMQAYLSAASKGVDAQSPTLVEFVRSLLNGGSVDGERWARDSVEPVYRPLKALSLGRLRQADFGGADLTRIGLNGVDLRRTGLSGCCLAQARMTAARLGRCDGVDVSYASLADADVDLDLLAAPTVKARFAVVGLRPVSGGPVPQPTAGESPDVAGDDEVGADDAESVMGETHQLLVVSAADRNITPVADIVAALRRQAAANKLSAVQVSACAADVVCEPSQRRARHQVNVEPAAAISCRRRIRKKRDSAAARAVELAAAGDSTETSDESAAADSSRPSRKWRRKKKTRSQKKPKTNSDPGGSGCLGCENSVAPVELLSAVDEQVSKNEVGGNDDVAEFVDEDESRQSASLDDVIVDVCASNVIGVCMASPELDALSCEPELSSSRPEPEVIDYSACSTLGSGALSSSRSPLRQSSPLPPATSSSLYGQQAPGFLLSDVHGSLPLLSRTLDDDRRLTVADDGLSGLPKSASLQGYQHLLSVDDSSRYHRRRPGRLTAAASSGRPLTGGRHTLSRLDVEYINRSQIFEMISVLNVQPLESSIPAVDSMLVGRDRELEDILDLVGSAGRVVTVVGCPGTGKSALAIAVADALRRKSVVSIRVDAAGCRSAAAVLRRLVSALRLHFRSDDPRDRKYLYNWLNAHEQRLLLLLDDVDDLAEPEMGRLGDVIDELMGNVRNVRVLCTTARRRLYRAGANRELYRLGDVSSSSEALVRRLVPDLHDEGVEALAAACEHLPLALRVVCAALSSDRVDVDAGRLFELLTAGGGSDSRMEAAVERLCMDDEFDQRRLRHLADCMLTTLNALTCTPSPTLLLSKTASFVGSGFDVDEAATALGGGVEPCSLRSTLDRLVELGVVARLATSPTRYRWRSVMSLLSTCMSTGADVVDIEAVYRREVITRLTTAADRYHESADGCIVALEAVDAEHDNVVDVLWRTLDREDAYVELSTLVRLDAAAFLSEVLPDDVYVAVFEAVERESSELDDCQTSALRSRCLSCLSYRHGAAGRADEAASCAERAVELSSSAAADGSEGETTVSALYCLSRAQKLGAERRKALSTARQAFDACKTTGLIVAAAELTNIVAVYVVEWYAWMLTQSDNFQTARHCYNLSDAIVRDKLQGHPLTVDGLSCRRAIWDRLSLFERATAAARGAADAATRRYGDHPRSALALTHHGDAIVKRGCLNEAIEAVTAALAMRVRVLGQRSLATASSYRTLAYLMLRSGQYDQAERFGRAALDACAALADDAACLGEHWDRPRGRRRVEEDLVSVTTEASDIVTQARYRQQSRSSVYVELETRLDVDERCAPRRARKL